jgi:Xaa-Pro aminopeptidase
MNPEEQASRLSKLRTAMGERDLAAYLVPRVDEHQSEYVAPADERLAWISGFNGSAGLAVVGRERAALFVDGRYTLQAHKQALAEFWAQRHLVHDSLDGWAKDNLARGDRIGFDPRLHRPADIDRLRKPLAKLGVTLVPIEANLVDLIWRDRPALPMGPVTTYPIEFAGESSAAKRKRMAAALQEARIDALVVSALDNLAWLFNVRGQDVAMTPIVIGYAILQSDATATLFVDSAKLSSAVRAEIEAEGQGAVKIAEPSALAHVLTTLKGKNVRLDNATANVFLDEALKATGATVDLGHDPCTAAKARKNSVQLAGARTSHRRDGVAMVRFLRWFGEAAPGAQTEWTAAEKLAAFRGAGENFRGPSFPTISASAGNAAEAHYRLEKATARPLRPNEIYLVDSGAQYLDGTTDVTRVLVTGTPTTQMKQRYTQVLKGHIAVSLARFPAGTTGAQLDSFARQFLWTTGADFDHGTGHGVGGYLSVHEGPQGISKRATEVSLAPGMIISVEPGYYQPDAFGIRIENLVAVRQAEPQPEGAELTVLDFETLTLVPYERRLIEIGMLTEVERTWIDIYHETVRDALTPFLSPDDAAFLQRATSPLRENSLEGA